MVSKLVNVLFTCALLLLPTLAIANPLRVVNDTVYLEAKGNGDLELATWGSGDVRIILGAATNTPKQLTINGTTGLLTTPNLKVEVDGDPNRLHTFDANSDTALLYKFGDGTTAEQFLSITGTRDDGYLILSGGTHYTTDHSGQVSIFGNEQSGSGGNLKFKLGNVAGATGYITSSDGSFDRTRWKFAQHNSGNIEGDATYGGHIILYNRSSGFLAADNGLNADITDKAGVIPGLITQRTSGSVFNAAWIGDGPGIDGPIVAFFKTDATDGDADTIVSTGTDFGAIRWYGADGAAYQQAAELEVVNGAVPGSTDMAGNMVFKLSPDGSATPVQVLRLGWDLSALFSGEITPGGYLVANLPTACTAGSVVRATDSDDCSTGSGNGATCICNNSGNGWVLGTNY